MIEAVEAAKLLNLSLRDVSEVATACGDAQQSMASLCGLKEYYGMDDYDNDDDFAKNTDAEKARLHNTTPRCPATRTPTTTTCCPPPPSARARRRGAARRR